MTRARDRLYVCGFQGTQKRPEGSWYELVSDGLQGLTREAQGSDGMAVRTDGKRARRDAARFRPGRAAAPCPAFARMGGAAGARGARQGRAHAIAARRAWRRGKRPSSPRSGRPSRRKETASRAGGWCMRCCSICRTWAARRARTRPAPSSQARGRELAEALRQEIVAETLAVLADPDFAPLFGPTSLAEVPIVARIGEGEEARELTGQIDRLVVLEEALLVLDYKTNRPPPTRPEEVAPAYIAQLAAYRIALQALFPGRGLARGAAVDRRAETHGNPINFA